VAASHQRRAAATEPQVPGPGFPKPAPKKVATIQAHRVLWTEVLRTGSSVIVVRTLGALGLGDAFQNFRVEDRGGDLVVSAGPLAEIDTAAAVAAEREIFGPLEDQSLAGGAA